MLNQPSRYGVVFVTAASKAEGETIAAALVENQLAACVSLFPVQSIYVWQGKVNSEQEWQLLIKTNLDQFSAVSAKIRELHAYEVPEIVALPIVAGSEPYLNWIAQNVPS